MISDLLFNLHTHVMSMRGKDNWSSIPTFPSRDSSIYEDAFSMMFHRRFTISIVSTTPLPLLVNRFS